MTTATPFTLDGYLDDLPRSGDDGTTADFRLISSPTGDPDDETSYTCRTTDPHLAHALLSLMNPGDLLRVEGHLVLPGRDDHGDPRITVDALELLVPTPLLARTEMVLDRYGPYLLVLAPDTDTVPVFRETGAWIGLAADIAAVADLIHAHESSTPPADV
ncbi:hypothetical protein ACFCZ6_14195 [Streptomyces hydrogenans]|uniref:hypothetical protein n=1 Tax=Streptomyces hydrogenans TaxID=1873719 RepID=UPI0035E3BC1D